MVAWEGVGGGLGPWLGGLGGGAGPPEGSAVGGAGGDTPQMHPSRCPQSSPRGDISPAFRVLTAALRSRNPAGSCSGLGHLPGRTGTHRPLSSCWEPPAGVGSSHGQRASQVTGPPSATACMPLRRGLATCAQGLTHTVGRRCPHLRVSCREAGIWPGLGWRTQFLLLRVGGTMLGKHPPSFLPAAWSRQAWGWATRVGTPHILVSVFPAVGPRGHRQGFLGRMCREPPANRALERCFPGSLASQTRKVGNGEASPPPRRAWCPRAEAPGGPTPRPSLRWSEPRLAWHHSGIKPGRILLFLILT